MLLDHQEEWREATRHPFLEAVSEGTFSTGAFEAWRGAAPGHPDYREFVEHWTTEEFAGYVAGLREAADASLKTAGEDERRKAKTFFLEVARLERGFWEMAWSGGGG